MSTRVLVVEDDPDIAELVARYLEKAGYTATRVSSGRDALDAVRAKAPDLIVLDVMLPHVDGLEVCRLLRANEHTASIPIIMLTARAEESERIVGLEMGADDYLAKPFSPNELVARVRALLRRAQRARRAVGAAALARRDRRRSRPAYRLARRPRGRAHREGISAAGVSPAASRPGLVARRPARAGVGLSLHRRNAHGRRPRAPAPREAAAVDRRAGHGQAVRIQTGRSAVTSRTGTFQAKFFFAALASAVIALVVAGALFAAMMRSEVNDEIGATLVAQARLAADLLAPQLVRRSTDSELDAEADRLGALTGTRVTLIAPDGRVVGDSSETLEGVAAMENHGLRPEVVEARAGGLGRAERHSDTLNIDMLYVAVPVRHPAIAFVRVALPLTDVRQHVRSVLTILRRRASGSRSSARRSSPGCFPLESASAYGASPTSPDGTKAATSTPTRMDFGDDELGVVARSLDESVQDVGRRLAEQARDRARMEAILAGHGGRRHRRRSRRDGFSSPTTPHSGC